MRRENIKWFTSRSCGKRVTLAVQPRMNKIISAKWRVFTKQTRKCNLTALQNPRWISAESISQRVLVDVQQWIQFHSIVSFNETISYNKQNREFRTIIMRVK